MKKLSALLLAFLTAASCCIGAAAAETGQTPAEVTSTSPETTTEAPAAAYSSVSAPDDGFDATQATEETEATEAPQDAPAALLCGDANNDGFVDIMDASTVQKYIAEEISREELNFDAADVDFDDDVTIQDVTMIQMLLAEYLSEFDIPKLLTLTPESLRLKVGEGAALTTSYTPEDGAVSFSTNDPNVAEVDENGVVTAVGSGNAIITAKADRKQSAYCTVEVYREVTSVTLNCTELKLKTGETFQLTTTIPDGEYNPGGSFGSDNAAVAAVDSESGLVTAKAAGVTEVYYLTQNGVSARCKVTVYNPNPTSVGVSEPMVSLGIGEIYALHAFYDSGDPAYGARFASDKPSVASVDAETGSITARAAGTAVVTVTSVNGKTAKCWLTVKNAPSAIAFSASNLRLLVGEAVPLHVYPADREQALGSVAYESSNEDVCSIDDAGVLTANSEGAATVTATAYNGRTAKLIVSVSASAGSVTKTTTAQTVMVEDASWKSAVITAVPKGVSVKVLGYSDDSRWLRVQYKTACGWIYNKAVGVAKNYTSVTLATLPVVADDIIFNCNDDLKTVYDYVQNTVQYRASYEGNSIEEMAVSSLSRLSGACYQRASTLFCLMDRMGYDVLYVIGHDELTGNNHRWDLVKTNEGWRHIDPTQVRLTWITLPKYYLVKDSALQYFTWDRTKYPAAE